jgi:arginyl-tRNA synthetase
LEEVADVLGITCLIANDFKRRRVSNYEFDWKTTMDQRGDSGISLQYAHSRLSNLKANSGLELGPLHEMDLQTIDWTSIEQEEALDLCVRISQLDEVLELSYAQFEPFYLLKHLFSLR